MPNFFTILSWIEKLQKIRFDPNYLKDRVILSYYNPIKLVVINNNNKSNSNKELCVISVAGEKFLI